MRYFYLVLWFILGLVYWYVASNYCCEPNTSVSEAVVPIKKPCPPLGDLNFQWNSKTPNEKKGEQSTIQVSGIDSLMNIIGQNQKLQITGKYREGESDIGMARAEELSKLLGLDENKIQLSSRKVPLGDSAKDCAFSGISYRLVRVTEKIKEIDDKTLIYFPYASTKKLSDTEVEAYLDDVAERVIKSGEKVSLIGHTDNDGSPEYNLELGLARANVIRSYLIGKGVSPNNIVTQSKGESLPIGNNETASGQAQNRRTELQIIQ